MLKISLESMSEIIGSSDPSRKQDAGDLFQTSRHAKEKTHRAFRTKAGSDVRGPNLIVPYEDDLDDFFATWATYYSGLGPITAFSYVTTSEDAERLLSLDRKANSAEHAPKAARFACYGAAIGEAMLLRWNSKSPDDPIDFAIVRSMLSFSLCRSKIVHGLNSDDVLLSERWRKLQELAGREVSEASIEVAQMVQSVAFGKGLGLPGTNPSIRLAASLEKAVSSDGSELSNLEEALLSLYPGLGDSLHRFRGAFDERIDAFLSSARVIMNESCGARIDDIAVGYICNRIRPGSFEHGGILKGLRDAFPIAIIWYGVFAANSLYSHSKGMGDGLFSKLERDALEPFSIERRPKCDISFGELDVLLRAAFRLEDLLPSHAGAAIVSVADGVDVEISLVDREGAIKKEGATSEQRVIRAKSLLEEALRMLSGELETSHRAAGSTISRRKSKP